MYYSDDMCLTREADLGIYTGSALAAAVEAYKNYGRFSVLPVAENRISICLTPFPGHDERELLNGFWKYFMDASCLDRQGDGTSGYESATVGRRTHGTPHGMQPASYTILPVRFARFSDNKYILTNDCGEFIILADNIFQLYVTHALAPETQEFYDLQSKGFLQNSGEAIYGRMLASKYKTKK